jgi:DNA helicase II / ATP-dependent DNA helicase PcrA
MSQINFDETFNRLYSNLNKEQKEAVDFIDGPVIVNAGPGTGKTQLLALRVANILKQSDVSPRNILCLTFTDAASLNMRKRLVSIIGREGYQVGIFTFHSFSTDIINNYFDHFFDGKSFQPIDKLVQLRVLTQIFTNLSWNNPLKSYHRDLGFTYLKSTLEIISGLKKEGLNQKEFDFLLNLNQEYLENINLWINEHFSVTVSKELITKLPDIQANLHNINKNPNKNPFLKLLEDTDSDLNKRILSHHNLPFLIQDSFDKMVEEVLEVNKTPILTDWKKTNCKHDNTKKLVHKDFITLQKYKAVSQIYELYQQALNSNGWFDFDDMLLEVNRVLEDPLTRSLKYDLQERYQYILVDEFQDTNGVQMRLLFNLIYNDLFDDNPNILVVGDPDQAIFKFQGATLSNLEEFHTAFPKAKVINMITNYRSTQKILDLAHDIIEVSNKRMGIKERLLSHTNN